MRQQVVRWSLCLAAVMSLWAVPAQAALILSGTIGGQNFCASDNNAFCGFGTQLFDTDGDLGTLALDTATIGGVTVEGSLHEQTIGSQNILNSSSLSIINGSGATVAANVAVSGTNFLGPIFQAFASGSGTWENAAGSDIALRWYNDPANNQGAETPNDLPGLLLAQFFDIAGPTPTQSFAFNSGAIPVIDPALFSMTLQFDMDLVSGGSLISRGQTLVKNQAVPEPAMVLLFGLGLAGVAAKTRRRFQR